MPGTTLAGTVSVSVAVALRVGRLAVGGHRFRRHEHLDRDDVLERVGLVADLDRHLHARAADALAGGVEPRFDRSAGGDLQRLLGAGR